MSKPKVLLTREVPGPAFGRLFEECAVTAWEQDSQMPRERLLEKVGEAEGLHIIWVDRVDLELLEAAPKLKVVSNYAVGVDNIDLKACTARGIPVGHAPGVVTEATADTAFALMLSVSRRIQEGALYVREGKWKEWSPGVCLGNEVFGKTIGIVGLGRIGQAIARRARGFGMRILYHNRRPNSQAGREFAAEYRGLDDLLAEADLVVLSMPYSPETHHMIDAAALAKMKPSAYLVNVARGGVVDSRALHQALSTGLIRGAGLDVTEPEPIPPDDPLLSLDNCLIIPHIGTSTWETRSAMAEISVANLLRGLRGEPLLHCANPEVFGGS